MGIRSSDMAVATKQMEYQDMQAMVSSKGWTRDLAAEQLFDRIGAEYEYVTIPTNQINQGLSLQNQARLEVSLVQETVEEYAEAMRNGAAFPALAVFPLGDGTYRLAGGNHRLGAALAVKRATVDAYLIRASGAEMQRLITTSLNSVVGMRPRREELVLQAISAMEQFGRTQVFVANQYNVPVTAIQRTLSERSSRTRLRLAGISPDTFSKDAIRELAKIPSDEVLRRAATLQEDAALQTPVIRDIVRQVMTKRSEAEQLAYLEEVSSRPDIKSRKAEKNRGRPTPTNKRRMEILRGLRTVEHLLDKYTTRGQVGLADDDEYGAVVSLAYRVLSQVEALNAVK